MHCAYDPQVKIYNPHSSQILCYKIIPNALHRNAFLKPGSELMLRLIQVFTQG